MPRYSVIVFALLLAAGSFLQAGYAASSSASQPSFDCKVARTSAERLICSEPGLARMGVGLADLYTRARQQSTELDTLRKAQLGWLRERDEVCIAGETFEKIRTDESVRLCMTRFYSERTNALRALVDPPLMTSALRAISAAALDRIGLSNSDCKAAQGMFDEQGRELAIEMDCEPAGKGRRVWLVNREDEVIAATPELGAGDPNSEAVRGTDTDLYWDRDTLYVFTSMQKKKRRASEASEWAEAFFIATRFNGSTQIVAVPERIRTLFELRAGSFQGGDPMTLIGDDQMIVDSALSLAPRLQSHSNADGSQRVTLHNEQAAWLADDGGDFLSLRVRNLGQGEKSVEIARGESELIHVQFDAWHLVYPSPVGILVYDLKAGVARRVVGTSADDVPLAWNIASGHLAWVGPRPCGGVKGRKGQYLCVAHVQGVKQP